MDAAAARPPFGDPTLRLVGHYDGTPPQLEALRVSDDPARGRAPAGMDTALLAYSGISVKMLVDRTFGADHVTMFTVDYELGGAAQAHDHPFEEAYFFLAGRGRGRARRAAVHAAPGRHRVRERRVGPWLLQHRDRTGPLARDAGAAAAGPACVPLGGQLGTVRAGTTRTKGGSAMSEDGSVVVVGGTRAIGLGDRPPLRRAGTNGRPDRTRPGARRRRPSRTSVAPRAAESLRPLRARRRSRRRSPTSGPSDRLVLAAIDRDYNSVADYDIARAIRLVTLKLVGYTEVVHTLLGRLTPDASVLLFGGMAKERPVPGIDDGHDDQRRRRRADPDARRGAAAATGQLDPSRRRR